MKRTFLTFAVIALVATFTSCKQTPAEQTETSPAEAMEITPAEETPQIEEIPQVEEVDSTVVDTVVEDNTDTTL